MVEARYTILSDLIAQGIKKGRWKGRLPGMIKLAKELDADPATLSRAFKLLADRGLVTIQGTKGTFITQPGQRARHKVIGIVGITSNKIVQSKEMDVMESEAGKLGYRLVVLAHNNIPFIDDAKLLLKFPVDGFIFMYSCLTFELAAFLREKGMPFVSCNNPVGIPGVNWTDFDSEGSFEMALRHLACLGGRRIAYIEYDNPYYDYTKRMLETYKRTLASLGLDFDKDLFISGNPANRDVHVAEALEAYGRDCARKLVAKGKTPDAAVFATTEMCRSFMKELKASGAIAEDLPSFSYCSKYTDETELSTILYDYGERASLAVRLLADLIENPMAEAKRIPITRNLVPRGRCILDETTTKKQAGELCRL